ncbi:50S ribosomal protein L3 [Candidatus Woesearchaeota archaeon]|nr:50S ribosomal protein L3 [Candidatus Woesearchaeota archaeon]|tara:strand:+ start:9309 stop:10292 length:984 start_codon:yes stop_codon:yes gene_type:complete
MPTIRKPRKGSLAYWPRKHAKRMYPKIRHYAPVSETKLAGFAGYKAGMTHIFIADNRPHSITKGKSIMFPVTVLECPPLKIASIRFYKSSSSGLRVANEIFSSTDKLLAKKVKIPKKPKELSEIEKKLGEYVDVRVNVYTQPQLAGINKKRPEIFEVALGGKNVTEKFNYAKSVLGKEIPVQDVFKEGQQIDIFAVSKAKGTQGPVKRFGIGLRQAKSEKGVRGPANLGPWKGNRSWRVAHAGRMGFHNRLDKNKLLIKIGEKPEEVNVKGGFIKYGLLKSNYLLLKGSIPGATKRLIRLVNSYNPNRKLPTQAPSIELISLNSPQK